MRYLVAVSGGIDSVVLLDMLVKKGGHDVTVAHFDHGVRADSAADARFVRELAHQYGLPFVAAREELGPEVSEATARRRRYVFLRAQAAAIGALIVTAHHADDVVETVAINMARGTGWRGLAVLDTPGIARPLTGMTKQDIRAYALRHRLEWVEDSTNATDRYLRNRLRRTITSRLSRQQKTELLDRWQRQRQLKRSIDHEARRIIGTAPYYRYPLIMADQATALELLRAIVVAEAAASPTRPQLERALLAVKTARHGMRHHVGDGRQLVFSRRTFIVETL